MCIFIGPLLFCIATTFNPASTYPAPSRACHGQCPSPALHVTRSGQQVPTSFEQTLHNGLWEIALVAVDNVLFRLLSDEASKVCEAGSV
jgi:hypothetical protein